MGKSGEERRGSIGARRNPASADAILDAAKAELIEKGYAGFSIEGVARRARAGKPTIYRWWPTKSALLLDVYQRQKGGIDYGGSGSIEEDMFRFLRSLMGHWRKTSSGSIFRSLVAEAQSNPEAAAALADYAAFRRGHSGQMVRDAQARGEVPADVDPEIVADLLSSYAWSHLLTDRLDEDDATIRRAVHAIARGILTKPAAG
ncbi:MAG: TetR/AcrR family transcriptional regulator [Bauldia sp.]|nr:TetR/AcrR family transcriptional regulator [Bauldia sp.]